MIAYIPKPFFPSVTLSKKCMLNCKHCMGKFLHQMVNIEQFKDEIKKGGEFNGVLISSGFDREGRLLNLEKHLPFMEDLKKKIYVAIHPGFVDEKMAEKISNAANIAFVDIPSSDAIKNVFGLNKKMEDYMNSMHLLQDAGLKISPHITAGLNYGKIEEWEILDEIKYSRFEKLVLNFIVPTAKTPFEKVRIDEEEAINFFKEADKKIKKISIGCMRPRHLDIPLIKAGAKEMTNPSRKAMEYMGERSVEILRWCCGVSREDIFTEKNRKGGQQ